MSFGFEALGPEQDFNVNPAVGDAELQHWIDVTKVNSERAVIAGRAADMARHIADTASKMAISSAGKLLLDKEAGLQQAAHQSVEAAGRPEPQPSGLTSLGSLQAGPAPGMAGQAPGAPLPGAGPVGTAPPQPAAGAASALAGPPQAAPGPAAALPALPSLSPGNAFPSLSPGNALGLATKAASAPGPLLMALGHLQAISSCRSAGGSHASAAGWHRGWAELGLRRARTWQGTSRPAAFLASGLRPSDLLPRGAPPVEAEGLERAESHRDPYLMRGVPLGSKRKGCDKDGEQGGDGHRRAPSYNALRQSQSVSDSPAQFLNSLRCCYAEVAAPKGALVLLRGNSHNQSGKQVLAEYVQHPEEEVGPEFWRDADADEALAGYLDAAGRRVAYPWRQRLVRVICPIPKELIASEGSSGLRKQLNSSKLMRECDAAMLRGYAEEWLKKKKEESPGKGKREGEEPESRTKRGRTTTAELPNHKRQKVAVSSSAASSAAASSSTAAPVCTLSTFHAKPTQPCHPSYQPLYDLLEQTHFPKGGQRPNVAGYENVTYLIFGLHRRRDTHQLELTEATRLAYGRLRPEEQEWGEQGRDSTTDAGDEAECGEPAKPADAAHYRVLLEAVLRHFWEVGLGSGACSAKRPPPAPRFRRRPGVRDPLRGKFIPAGDVFFTSVMVAKNKRTFMHRDANNKGPSYQVVVTDASCVGSGEFQGGNLLAWPDIERGEADRRVAELRDFWEQRRRERQERRERMRHVNPVNARWVGEGDEVKTDPETGELLIVQPELGRSGGQGHGDDGAALEEMLMEEGGGIGLRSLSDEARKAARLAVYHGSGDTNVERGEPTHDEDATVVQCLHRYVSFDGKRCFHATQPWTQCANRYCITFFGINLEGGGARHAKLRRELEAMGFRPHPVGMEEGGVT